MENGTIIFLAIPVNNETAVLSRTLGGDYELPCRCRGMLRCSVDRRHCGFLIGCFLDKTAENAVRPMQYERFYGIMKPVGDRLHAKVYDVIRPCIPGCMREHAQRANRHRPRKLFLSGIKHYCMLRPKEHCGFQLFPADIRIMRLARRRLTRIVGSDNEEIGFTPISPHS